MLKLEIPGREMWDEVKQEFIYTKDHVLSLEHSLVSIAKWESKWHKPFLSEVVDKTNEEIIDYVRCMTLTQNVDPNIYRCLTSEHLDRIQNYISNPMTATTFTNQKRGSNSEVITSELVYYWMIQANVPIECQKWHINRLLTLLEVCAVKSEKPKKMSKSKVLNQNAALNKARRAQMNTKG